MSDVTTLYPQIPIEKEPIEPEVDIGLWDSAMNGWNMNKLGFTFSALEEGMTQYTRTPDDPTLEDVWRLTPAEAKEFYDLDVDGPISDYEAIIRSSQKREKQETAEEFIDVFKSGNPFNMMAGLIGMAAAVQTDPTTLALEALFAPAGPLAVGGAFAVKYMKAMRIAARVAAAYKQSIKAQKIAKAMQLAKVTALAERAARVARRVQHNSLVRTAAVNSFEEFIIALNESTKGNKYSLGQAAALGAFGPVALKGLGKAFKYGGRGTGRFFRTSVKTLTKGARKADKALAKVKKKIAKRQKLTKEDLDVLKAQPRAEVTLKKEPDHPGITPLDKKVMDADTIEDVQEVLISVPPIERIHPELEVLESIVKLGRIFGRTKVTRKLAGITSQLLENDINIKLDRLFPFLTNDKTLTVALRKFKKAGKTADDIDEFFAVSEGKFAEYIETHKTPKPKPVTEDVSPTREKVSDETVHAEKQLDDMSVAPDVVGDYGKAGKRMVKELDKFVQCLITGGGLGG